MRKIYASLFSIFSVAGLYAQTPELPVGFAPGELAAMPAYIASLNVSERAGITNPPGGQLRTMAEWEEIQALVRSGGILIDVKSALPPQSVRPDIVYWSL